MSTRGGRRHSGPRARPDPSSLLFVHAFEQASHGGERAAGVEAGVVTPDRIEAAINQ